MSSSPASTAAGSTATPPPGAPIFDYRDRVVVLTPCYGGQVTDVYLNSLQACQQAAAWFRMPDGSVQLDSIIADRISLISESHIDRGRNTLTAMWLERIEKTGGPRKALWWDADVELAPHHLMRLYLHSAQRGHAFVCGAYASKTLRPSFIANVKAGAKIDSETGLVEIYHGGTGCMLWDASVPAKLRQHARVLPYTCAPNSPWKGQVHYTYFSSGPYGTPDDKTGHPQWQSEDWMVSMLWQDLGEKVYLDTEVKCRHHGSLTFPPNVDDIEDAIVTLIDQRHPALDTKRLGDALANPKRKPAA